MNTRPRHGPICIAGDVRSLEDGTLVRGLSPVPGIGGRDAIGAVEMLSTARRDQAVEQMAQQLLAIRLSSGAPAFDSYSTAKDASKVLKPLVEVFTKSAEAGSALRLKDPAKAMDKGVEAFAALTNSTHYGIKLAVPPQAREWEVAARLFQQSAKTAGFMKALKLATPQGQAAAVGVLATEKILLQAGIVTKSQGIRCATALATLAADGVGMAALGAATGGVAAALFAVSIAWSAADATYQCSSLLLDTPAAPLPPFTGYFTMLKYLVNQSPTALEKRLGFHEGRLASGYRIIVLASGSALAPDEFELVGSTRWSDGVMESSAPGSGEKRIGEALEGRLGPERLRQSKEQVARFFAKEPGNAPAKLIPTLVDKDGSMAYPRGDAHYELPPEEWQRAGVPQFRMVQGARKPAALYGSWSP